MTTRTAAILAALILALAACTTSTPGGRNDAFSGASASARAGASHALVSPGTAAGAMAAAKTR